MGVKHFTILLSLIIISFTSSPLDAAAIAKEEGKSPSETSPLGYKVNFFSLKRGHSIAPSYFDFSDEKTFTITMPDEEFVECKGSFSRQGLQFRALWEGTVMKKKKHYCYTFDIKGFSLLESYIAGMVVLTEKIEETGQDQEVTFLFLGTNQKNTPSEENRRSPLPF